MVLFVNGNFSIFFNVLKIAKVRPLVCQKRPYNPIDIYIFLHATLLVPTFFSAWIFN